MSDRREPTTSPRLLVQQAQGHVAECAGAAKQRRDGDELAAYDVFASGAAAIVCAVSALAMSIAERTSAELHMEATKGSSTYGDRG